MIYLVTGQLSLFENAAYKTISAEESLEMMKDWNVVQYDSETDGRDAHINKLLCAQFGNDAADTQIVVDTSTINILLYKNILESKTLIGQNLKFDLAFLYNYNIKPRKIYDTMIVEQLLHLGYPSGTLSYSLKAIANRRLGIDIDKTVRGEIIWRGLDTNVIIYAAGDVMYLEKIAKSQLVDLKKQDLVKAAKLECDFIPSLTYMEWCGILLDETKWKKKMRNDAKMLEEARKSLNSFIVKEAQKAEIHQGTERYTPINIDGTSGQRIYKELSDFVYINLQGDLFTGFDTTPHCTVNWDSPRQVTKVFQILGFNTTVSDKKTGKDKDSVLEKVLSTQKGINDEFLKIYFDYREHAKVCSTYGQGHLNMINPNTGRIHTVFKQLGAASGRLSCGSNQPNTDLAKAKQISPKNCTYCNLQQLPADHPTRSSFVAPKGYKFVSADFSAEESRLGADIYQDKAFLKEFTEGSKDTHNMFAWIVYHDECAALGCKDATEVKEKAPKWRKKVKGYEFGYMFGAAAPTLAQTAGSTVEEAQAVVDKLDKAFAGMTTFAKKGSRFVRQNGYILMCKETGHKMYWWDHDKWLNRQKSFTSEFWDEYRARHKGTNDAIAQEVREHFQAASKWDRMARNAVTQGTGAVIMKDAMTSLFNWIVDNDYFGKIHICVSVHDEINCDYPEEIESFPKVLTDIMESSAAKYCKSLPIPAEAAVGDYWIH